MKYAVLFSNLPDCNSEPGAEPAVDNRPQAVGGSRKAVWRRLMFCQKRERVFGELCRTFGIVLLLLAASQARTVNAAEWRGDIVDSFGGMFSSMKFDVYGNAHVIYLNPAENQLRYA